jgi:tetratricopeptide (TPR) repeat protein
VGKHGQPVVGRLIAVAALFAALCAPSRALAQSSDARKQALEHFSQAEAYMKAKAYDMAVKEYQAAYALVPKPGFLFNVGLAYESAGDKKSAAEHYRRYLAAEPKGRASTEARARLAALERVIAAEERAAAEAEQKRAEEEKRKQAAKVHADAAAQLRGQRKYDKAAEELRAAYAEHPDPEYVYRLAEVYRLKGDKPAAVVEYEHYRELAPTGVHSPDAIRKITSLRQEIAAASLPKPEKQPPIEVVVKQPTEDKPKKRKKGRTWTWIAIGAAAIAGGLVADLVPSNARNGELDGTDFIPLPCYAMGGVFLLVGVF